MGRKKKVKEPKPDTPTRDVSGRRDTEPGPSWSGSGSGFQAESQGPSRGQHYQRPHQASSPLEEVKETGEGDNLTSPMRNVGLREKEEEGAWGAVRRDRGRQMGSVWGPPQQQGPPQQGPQQPPVWPRPTHQSGKGQPRPQIRPQIRPATQTTSFRGQAQPETSIKPSQSFPGTTAWARGPPSELHGSYSQTFQSEKATKGQPLQAEKLPKTPSLQLETFKAGKSVVDFMDYAPRICAPQKTGRSIQVATNFFVLSLDDYNITVFHYDVVFEPDVPKSLLRKAWNITSETFFPKRITVFDGMSNVFTKGPLVNGTTFRGELTINHPDSNKSKDYTVMLKEVRRIPMNALCNYRERIKESTTLDSRKKAVPLAEMSVIEVILKNWPANYLVQSNRVFFPRLENRPRAAKLSDRLDLRYGYFQSAFLGYRLYLNFDVAHRPFYRSDYLGNALQDLERSSRPINAELEDLNYFLKGAKVEYSLPNDRKTRIVYRVNKLVKSACDQTFEKDGKVMTVAEYFLKEKNYRLRYPKLPLVWVGSSTKTIYLPLELVRLCPDQLYKGMLSPFETKKMVMEATTDARRRKAETLQAFAQGNFDNNPFLKEFGIRISKSMETVQARVLEPPKLKTSTMITVKEGCWKTRSFLEAKSFDKWCILNLDKYTNKNSLMVLQKSLQLKAREFNMNIGEPEIAPLDKGGTYHYYDLQRIFSSLKKMNIVIVVIPDTKGLYSKVKTICETQEGILTQCLKGKNVSMDSRKMMTTLDNLLLKINAKLGGTNHTLFRNSVPQCLEGCVMVVGADVTHAGPGSKIPSVAAVSVCCEVSAFQYSITTRVQNGEIIQDLKDIMIINLHRFHSLRRKYPEKIFFYRDGVSEGEMEKVLRTEYRALREACNDVSCKAKITLLVVQKRHHTRFFPMRESEEEGKTFNVPVGTCVDTDIVHPGGLDFYLLSHGSLLGTARPTRYRLLHDDNQLMDDQLEQLTFYLCHLYSRCNRSVSYPTPTYNAHLAAFRARAYLEGLNLTEKDDLKMVQNKLKDVISSQFPMFFV